MPGIPAFYKDGVDGEKSHHIPYYFKAIDTFYDVVLKGTHQGNVIDIFCLDSTGYESFGKSWSATNSKVGYGS